MIPLCLCWACQRIAPGSGGIGGKGRALLVLSKKEKKIVGGESVSIASAA
jgi:hypothetical protein